MYPNPSGRKRIACSAFYEVVQNRYTPSSANFKESLTAGLPLKKPETLSNCVEPLLMTYSASLNGLFRGMASYVDRILKGADPANLALEQPREFELLINLKTARSLGLVIPSSLLVQTTDRIE